MNLDNEIKQRVEVILEFLGKLSTKNKEQYYASFSQLELIEFDLYVLSNVMANWIYYAFENSEIRLSSTGEFYKFLLEVKPLLKNIGIDLGKENSLGACARRVLRQHKNTLSFLNIEEPSLQLA